MSTGEVREARVREKGQVTIPRSVREWLGIEEGDVVEFRVEGDQVILMPTVTIPRDQAWFWERDVQEQVRAAHRELALGVGTTFSSGEDFLASLDSDVQDQV